MTLTPITIQLLYIHFNSHAHVERDLFPDKDAQLKNISTHTLTWSVTISVQEKYESFYISTHTLTWSVTQSLDNAIMGIAFQLTRSRGA